MQLDMLAGRLRLSETRLVMERLPVPEPGYGQALIKVHAAGVCLSDVHLLDGTISPVFLDADVVTLGHEVAGTIEALGAGTASLSRGQRVLLHPGQVEPGGRVLTRGVDYDGGWAEYTLARADTIIPIPDSLPFEQAAIMPDAVSTPWSAVTGSGQVRPGDAAGVWGLGGLGTHAVQLLRLVGAAPIIALDPIEAARSRALAVGADVALDPSSPDAAREIKVATQGRGIDAAFDFAGAPSVREQAFTVLAPGGRLVLVGLAGVPVTIPQDSGFSFRRQTVVGAYGSEPKHLARLVRLAERGRLDLSRSVSVTLPLAQAPDAVRQLKEGVGSPVRIVLIP